MAHDLIGKEQYVQHALMQNERSKTPRCAVKIFKHNNPAWTKLQCVASDNDFAEMAARRASLLAARVLLCQSHVIQYIREEISADVYRFTAWQMDRLKSVIELLVYWKPELQRQKHRVEMQHQLNMASTTTSTVCPETDSPDSVQK